MVSLLLRYGMCGGEMPLEVEVLHVADSDRVPLDLISVVVDAFNVPPSEGTVTVVDVVVAVLELF